MKETDIATMILTISIMKLINNYWFHHTAIAIQENQTNQEIISSKERHAAELQAAIDSLTDDLRVKNNKLDELEASFRNLQEILQKSKDESKSSIGSNFRWILNDFCGMQGILEVLS